MIAKYAPAVLVLPVLLSGQPALAQDLGMGEISFTLEPPVFDVGDPVLLTISAQQVEPPSAPMTLLRGVQADFTLTTLAGMPDEVNFLEPMDGALYAAFPALGDPPGVVNTVYTGVDLNPVFMYDLTAGDVVPLLDLQVIAGPGLVDWANGDATDPNFGMALTGDFGTWTFANGGLIGAENTPVPEPGAITLAALAAAVGLRRRRR